MAVYVREAHPTDGWRVSSNDRAGISILQPRGFAARSEVAHKCSAVLEITIPLVVDDIHDTVGHLYSGMPDRLYVIDRDGRVAFKSGRGPFGFKPREMEQSLIMTLLDQQRILARTPHGVPLLSNASAWKNLPKAECGANQTLPDWARATVHSLPRTTAAMLELDYLQRTKSPLDPKLRGKMRWVAAHANHSAYGEAYAAADLKRAGVNAAEIAALAGDFAGASSSERAALAFARKMTLAADTVTDAEVSQLMGQYGNEGVTAMVLLLAYANFQDRLVLSLGVPVERGGPLPPLEVRFGRKPADVAQCKVPPRKLPPASAEPVIDSAHAGPFAPAFNLFTARRSMDQQREREPRILVPTFEDVVKRLPPGAAPSSPVRIKWSLVCLGYQPQLASAWSACLRTFAEEAKQDRVFEESVFWVITATLHCFY